MYHQLYIQDGYEPQPPEPEFCKTLFRTHDWKKGKSTLDFIFANSLKCDIFQPKYSQDQQNLPSLPYCVRKKLNHRVKEYLNLKD